MCMRSFPVGDARAQLSRLIDDAVRTHERIEITKNGRRAVLLGADDFDGLLETITILADADEVRSITEGREQLRSSESFDLADVEHDMRAAGRL